MKNDRNIKSVFIIGSGRSGTSLLYEILAYHKDFAWISNYSNRYYLKFPPVVGINRLYRCDLLKMLLKKKFPKPTEGYKLWNWCHPVIDSPNDSPLFENDVNSGSRRRARRLVHDHIKHTKAKQFLNKNTRHCRRLCYLHAIFPDAKFIHIIRDGRAVVASLLNVPFWKNLNPWILNYHTEYMTIKKNLDDLEIATYLWKSEVCQIYNDKKRIPSDQFFEIKYENFVASPIHEIRSVIEFCELEWDKKMEAYIKAKNIVNMNERFQSRLSQNQIRKVESILRDFSYNIGYIF